MAQKPISASMAQKLSDDIWGGLYEVEVNPHNPEMASAMVCKECGKRYRPRSVRAMSGHKMKHS